MKHLFTSWSIIKKKLDSSRHVLLAFDYDGTLTPIVKRPELARLSLPMRNLLKELSKSSFFSLVIISGRPLAEIKRLVGIKRIIYAGNHGLEIEGPKIKFINSSAKKAKPLIKNIFKLLSKELASIKEVLVENKGLTLSVHFRLVKAKKALHQLDKIFYRLVNPWRNKKKIRLTFGKKVYEVRPSVEWDKGKCLNYLLAQKSFFKFTPLTVALGDDRTDEDIFKVIKNRGVSIFVGKPRTSSFARYYLCNVKEVKFFLERLKGCGNKMDASSSPIPSPPIALPSASNRASQRAKR